MTDDHDHDWEAVRADDLSGPHRCPDCGARMTPTEIPEADRIEVGARVRLVKEAQSGVDTDGIDAWDGEHGWEYVIDAYVPAYQRDNLTDPPYYMVDSAPGPRWTSGACIPHAALTVVATAAEHAEQTRPPTPEEVCAYVSSTLHHGFEDDFSIIESRPLTTPSDGSWPEQKSDLLYGVEFYGRTAAGVGFGCVVRVTAMWETTD